MWCRRGGRRRRRHDSPQRGRLVLPAVMLLAAAANGALAAPSPQRAIERLEGCSAEELRQGCVRILRQERVDETRVRIKAEVRGGRIIWYELDLRSGAVRRVN